MSLDNLLSRWDKQYVWHPFTQMSEWQKEPTLLIESAKGNYLIDIHQKRYLDGVSSLWCNVHGHRVASINNALWSQANKVAHSTFLGLSHPSAVILSKKLIEIAPKGLKRVFYSDSGSASVEVAIKMAYQYWQIKGHSSKKTFLKLENAYHGDTLGSVSVGGIDLFHQIFKPMLFKTYQVPSAYAYRDLEYPGDDQSYRMICSGRVEQLLKKHHKQICAIIVEPLMQGAAGMLKAPRGFLSDIAKLAKRYNVLLIADEVATGFGRTGKMFACEQESVTPDLMCVAKGLTAGYLPLSATLTTEKIYNTFLGRYDEFKAFFHGHTYTANPLACAVAIANIDYFEKHKVLEKVQPKIKILSDELNRFLKLRWVGDIRQCGLMVGVELVQDKKNKKTFEASQRVGHKIAMRARSKGVIIRPLGNVMVLMPPLSITGKEIKILCKALHESIEEVLG